VSARLACCALAATAVIVALVLPTAALAARCDGVPTNGCLLPFPNDATQTKADKRTPTGRRVALTSAELPVNKDGAKPDPTEWNRNDGFSPGEPIIVHVPSLRSQAAFKASGIVPVNDAASASSRAASAAGPHCGGGVAVPPQTTPLASSRKSIDAAT